LTAFQFIANCFDIWAKIAPRLRARAYFLRTGICFKRIGVHAKIYGAGKMTVGARVSLGDFCWIEAVAHYGGQEYHPRLVLGDDVSVSDLTHISCVQSISIGDGCLLGSKIYIGDHNHGSTRDIAEMLNVTPARRPLGDAAEIKIGDRVWICDGAVILAGTRIASGSIVGANSVVSLSVDRPALIAGIPARVIRYLDNCPTK